MSSLSKIEQILLINQGNLLDRAMENTFNFCFDLVWEAETYLFLVDGANQESLPVKSMDVVLDLEHRIADLQSKARKAKKSIEEAVRTVKEKKEFVESSWSTAYRDEDEFRGASQSLIEVGVRFKESMVSSFMEE